MDKIQRLDKVFTLTNLQWSKKVFSFSHCGFFFHIKLFEIYINTFLQLLIIFNNLKLYYILYHIITFIGGTIGNNVKICYDNRIDMERKKGT